MTLTGRTRKAKRVRIGCDLCQPIMINGVFCHETGCPNSNARWDTESETWIRQRECFECGCTVDADDPCCSAITDVELNDDGELSDDDREFQD